MAISADDLRLIDAHIDARLGDIRVERHDFDRLETAVARLTEGQAQLFEGQAKLEAAVTRLTEGQAQLFEGQAKLEAAVTRLTEGQAKLEAAVTRLTEGQAKLEAAVTRLTEGQAKLEAAVTRLTEGQAKLADGLDALRKEVASLSENVGFGLEELAATFLPAYLEKKEGLRVSALARAFLPEGAANPEEVDLLGTAHRNGDAVTVVVECKGRIYGREVGAFLQKIERIAPHIPHPPYAVMVGYVVHPSAQRATDRVLFVSSHLL